MRVVFLWGAKGFTLLELAIVLLISGLMIVTAVQGYQTIEEQRRKTSTEKRLKHIEVALENFISRRGRYPCPARRGLLRSHADYALEADCSAPVAGIDCINSGVLDDAGTPRFVCIGMVPTRSLEVSDDFITDGYEYAYLYAITQDLTQPVIMFNQSNTNDANRTGILDIIEESFGAIDVVDQNDISILSDSGLAQYTLLSHGEYGIGAFNADGQLVSSCDSTTDEGENCESGTGVADSIFMHKRKNLQEGTSDFYDDYIVFRARPNL